MSREYSKPVGKTVAYLEKYCRSPLRSGYVTCKNTLLPEYFTHFGDQIANMNIRQDDIWVCTLPKTGSTMTREMVWCIANNVDLKAAEKPLWKRFPYLEGSSGFDLRKSNIIPGKNDAFLQVVAQNSVETVDNLTSPRFIKTHLPFNLLPEKLQRNETKTKIIYVTRNPRDVCISNFHFWKNEGTFTGNFEQFCELFLDGNVMYGPFWDHVTGYWEARKEHNILILKYEDMKKDLKSVIHKTANFLQKTLTEEQVTKLLDHLSFEKMKTNPAVNGVQLMTFVREYNSAPDNNKGKFLRSGEVNQWKEVMNEEQIQRFEEWRRENLKNSDATLVKFFDDLP